MALYAGVTPVLAGVSVVTFKRLALKGLENVGAAVLLVLPGMTIDTFVIHFFADVFPNMPASRATSFGSWLACSRCSVSSGRDSHGRVAARLGRPQGLGRAPEGLMPEASRPAPGDRGGPAPGCGRPA